VLNLHFEVPDIVAQFEDNCESADFIIAQIGLSENIYPPEFENIVETYAVNHPGVVSGDGQGLGVVVLKK